MSEILGGIIEKAKGAMTDTTDLLLMVVGAGSSAAALEVVKSWFPEQLEGVADETLAAGIGFALFYFGDRIHEKLVPFGFGMFLASIGAWSAEFVEGFILMLKKKEAT